MTISADFGSAARDVLARSLEEYRDLSLALKERITRLKAASPLGDDCTEHVAAAKAYHKALQTVLDLEASLVKRRRNWSDGGGQDLDLDAARAEILERLALWASERDA
jgi:hypothetical protein